MIQITIDDKTVECDQNTTILEAAKSGGIKIPTLCHNDMLKPYGACRICLVEAALQHAPQASKLVPACCTQAGDGMIIRTDTERVMKARAFIIELLLSRCPESEEIQRLAAEIGVERDNRDSLDLVGEYLLYRAPKPEHTKCIMCGLCVRVCSEITERHAISFSDRGIKRKVKTPFDRIAQTCIGCGSCAYVCPTNTITVEEATE